MFIMIAGVGIIGALASLMASLLIGESHATPEEEETDQTYQAGIEKELAAIRADLAALRQLMEENKTKDVQNR
jgi:hypothetical protein